MSKFRLFCLVATACILGLLGSEFLCRSTGFRDAAGRVFGQGRLVALTNGRGIYERDLDVEEVFTATDLVARENLRAVAQNESVVPATVDRELSLLRAQFAGEEAFAVGISSNGFSLLSVRGRIEEQLRSLQWLENQITAAPKVTEKECQDFYEAHRDLFTQPIRLRASHVFLAAPAGTAPEIVESKQEMIEALAVRLANGETLPQLAEEASEDEATKPRGGDLGFFSSARMPSDFFTEVEKLTVGRRSKPFRTHLGFHIVEVTEIRPARPLGFDEARGEISHALANERRALIVKRLTDMLSTATYAGSD